MNSGPLAGSDPLRRLAKLCGIQLSYVAGDGSRRPASPESLMAVLAALDVLPDASSPRAVATALQEQRHRRQTRRLPAIVVAWDGRLDVALRLPASAGGALAIRIVPRRGGGGEAWSGGAIVTDPRGNERVAGERWLRWRLWLRDPLPSGRYDLEVEAEGGVLRSHVIAAPRCLASDRRPSFGAFLPLYALHDAESWGIGSTTALARLCSWIGAGGGSFVGSTPLLAAFLDEPCDPSPYTPVSRLFWNEVFVDVTAAPEFATNERARALARTPEFTAEVAALQQAERVDYRAVMALKRRVLVELSSTPGPSEPALRAFAERQGRVLDYARFRAVLERRREPWQSWPERLQQGRFEAGDFDPAVERYHLYAQWLVDDQLGRVGEDARRRGVELYLDLPLGVHPSGYDAWRERELFVAGATVGAPPDAFFSQGQNWGFAPLHPGRSRAGGHAHLTAVLDHHLRHARVLRIDHVMAWHRLFFIPSGGTAADGVYVHYPTEELYAVAMLAAQEAGATIVGENLGTVPTAVNEELSRRGMLGMYVAQFAVRADAEDPLPEPPEACVAALNTHDTPTFAAFWNALDVDDRRDLGLLDGAGAAAERAARAAICKAVADHLVARGRLPPGTTDAGAVLAALLAELAAGPARLLLVNVEDLWLETHPQNVPGTAHERPNWVRKARLSLEAMQRDPGVMRVLERIAANRPRR